MNTRTGSMSETLQKPDGWSMDLRELKALEIAARSRITFDGTSWIIPSQSSCGTYRVSLSPSASCTCEDYQLRQRPCKHVIAARLVRERDGIEDAPKMDTEIGRA